MILEESEAMHLDNTAGISSTVDAFLIIRSIAAYIGAMQFLRTSADFPFSTAVIHSGRTLEAVLTGIPPNESTPVAGGAAAELREIFRQLDALLEEAGVAKTAIVSVRLYLQSVRRDIAEVNRVYRQYFGAHPPNRRAYGVDLQSGMLIEAAFVAELQ
jgi:2-iminobutanoate/2-iminopropanoate deaminase